MSSRKHHKPLLTAFAPLKLVVLLLNPPFLSPTEAYALITSGAERLHLTEGAKPLFACIHVYLKEAAPRFNTLLALDHKDHIMGESKQIWQELVPVEQQSSTQSPTYIIQVAPVQVQSPHPPKKETTPADIWDMEQLSLSLPAL